LIGQGFDVKIPWELSRFQYLPVLGKAYALTSDERYAAAAVQILDDWMVQNPYLFGVNWTNALEVAIRSCNWLWGNWFFATSQSWSAAFDRRVWNSLWQHGRFIRKNLEDWGRYRQNHYLANVVGLLFLGVMCPHFPDAEGWRNYALSEISRCMEEQIHPDGVDFENSIAYHRLVLEFFAYSAILCQRNGLELPAAFWQRLERMFDFVMAYMSSNGAAPHFGDSDDGRFFIFEDYFDGLGWDHRYLLSIGAVLFHRSDFKAAVGKFHPEAWWVLGEAGRRIFSSLPVHRDGYGGGIHLSRTFSDGGVYFLRSAELEIAVNAAEAGVHGEGGHKHNDTLHFDLVLCDQAILTDSGTFCYTGDPTARKSFRSTAAHNTVMADGREQNDLEDVFRLPADQVRVTVNRWASDEGVDILDVEHSGYTRLQQPLVHRRIFRLDKRRNRLLVVDCLCSSSPHQLAWRVHLAPGLPVAVQQVNPLHWKGTWGMARFHFRASAPFLFTQQESFYSDAYNQAVARPTFCAQAAPGVADWVAVLSISVAADEKENLSC
jgi:uncharacterized heparinase superfamily protein